MTASTFAYRNGRLFAEDVPVEDIAHRFGTPCYIYSRAVLEQNWCAYDQAFAGQDRLICYAAKANANLAVLDVLARLGSGFDIVSGGELERVIAAGGDPAKVVFSGIGKTRPEMQRALELGIHSFNIESAQELDALSEVARVMHRIAPISIRINPDVDPQTHPYIATGLKDNKFGVPMDEARVLYNRAAAQSSLNIKGVDFHIGSQLTSLSPYVDALGRVLGLIDILCRDGITVSHLNLGGGLGIRYKDEEPPEISQYAETVLRLIGDRELCLLMEPGRSIAGTAGLLATRVLYLKSNGERNFAVVDAAMNDLLRPALYGGWQPVDEVNKSVSATVPERVYDVVGPVCESADFLAKHRSLRICSGDLLAVHCVGAYGFVMSSNYNARPRGAEVMVDGAQIHLVRQREQIMELFAGEHLLPHDPGFRAVG